ncbi:MAG: carboxypeptidase regulatory-like domain-containing protein [Myxococcales bacterium]|nr:carboxypeptidase regulatory-like domain-containing protein [Myxococcales bacterium]
MARLHLWVGALLSVAALAVPACEGPEGPSGLNGAQGLPGDPGQPGQDGVDGQIGPTGQDGISIGAVAGTVTDAASGNPVAGATIATIPPSVGASTANDGTFSLAAVPIGVYTLAVTATGFGTQDFGPVSVTAGQTATIDPVLETPVATSGDVAGTVIMRSPNDDPVAGATVALVDAVALAGAVSDQPLEDLAALSPYTTTTAADGSYTIAGVLPGRYFVNVTPAVADVDALLPGGDASRSSVDVTAGDSATVDVTISQRPSSAATFIGSTTCLMCHAAAYSSWKETPHALIHRTPGVATANQDLSGYPTHDLANTFFVDGNPRDNTGAGDQLGLRITQAGFSAFPANMNFLLGFDGRYFVIIENPTGNVQSMKYYVEFTFGGHGLYKERWVTRASTNDAYDPTPGGDSSYYILPVQYDEKLQAGVEPFHPYNAANWGPPTVAGGAAVAPAQNKSFDNNCSGCHFTGTTLTRDGQGNFHADAVNDTNGQLDYDGDGQKDELDIGCEDCHGPGSEHFAAGGGKGRDIVVPGLLSAERDNMICGRCHTRGLGKGTVGGEVTEFPSKGVDATLELAWAGINHTEFVTDYHADNPGTYGDDRKHSRQHHQQYIDMLKSKHYKNPYRQLSCSDCHNLHNRDIGPSLTASSSDNTLCLNCHALYDFGLVTPWTKQAEGEAVSDHMTLQADMSVGYDPKNLDNVAPGTSTAGVGNCASCHMPKTAASQSRFLHETVTNGQPSGARVRGDISSHVFDFISPAASQVLFNAGGANNRMPNSCGSCHNNLGNVSPNYVY